MWLNAHAFYCPRAIVRRLREDNVRRTSKHEHYHPTHKPLGVNNIMQIIFHADMEKFLDRRVGHNVILKQYMFLWLLFVNKLICMLFFITLICEVRMRNESIVIKTRAAILSCQCQTYFICIFQISVTILFHRQPSIPPHFNFTSSPHLNTDSTELGSYENETAEWYFECEKWINILFIHSYVLPTACTKNEYISFNSFATRKPLTLRLTWRT